MANGADLQTDGGDSQGEWEPPPFLLKSHMTKRAVQVVDVSYQIITSVLTKSMVAMLFVNSLSTSMRVHWQ